MNHNHIKKGMFHFSINVEFKHTHTHNVNNNKKTHAKKNDTKWDLIDTQFS